MKKGKMTVAEAGRLGGQVKGLCKARPSHLARKAAMARWRGVREAKDKDETKTRAR